MITIIGAGPAGSYLASLLKEEAVVFEEHKTIGKPVQCTGITTQALAEILPVTKKFLINKITNAKIISPEGKHINVRLKKPNLIIDREKFDKHLAQKAQDNGAKYFLNQKYQNCIRKDKKIDVYLEGNIRKFQTDILIGADGPFSKVAKTTGLWKERKFAVGVQARVGIKTDPETLEFYVGKGYFGWVVPEDNKTARVGVATYTKANEMFQKLLKRKKITKKRIKEYQSGLMPLYNPKIKTQNKNIYLLGDAATQVKATTFGGIVQGMMAAEELNKSIQEKKNYQKLWKKRIGKELLTSLMIRNKLDKFKDKKYNNLVNLFSNDKIKQLIETHDRDYPSKFMLKLFLREPRMLQFLF